MVIDIFSDSYEIAEIHQNNISHPKGKRSQKKSTITEYYYESKRSLQGGKHSFIVDIPCNSYEESYEIAKIHQTEITKPISQDAIIDPTRSTHWNLPELLAQISFIDINHARNIINLFETDNTIPFIYRYRRDLIGINTTVGDLLLIKQEYTDLLNLKLKIDSHINELEKRGILTFKIKENFLKIRSFDELELMYAPYKKTKEKSLAERACKLGLEQPAKDILNENCFVDLESFIKPDINDLNSKEKVIDGIKYIIANIFSKNSSILEEIRKLQESSRIVLQTSLAKPKESDNMDEICITNDMRKFEKYFDFEILLDYIKPHQILAINRGEKLKILKVKIQIPDSLKLNLKKFIEQIYMKKKGFQSKNYKDIFNKSFEEVYNNKFQQLITRQIRAKLTKTAEKAAIDRFATNLKQLLLSSPVKGEKILGIDPGFAKGCKCALINEYNDLLVHFVIYPCVNEKKWEDYGHQLRYYLTTYKCNLIALGNGTACRETEKWLTKLYGYGIIDRQKHRYCIVSEQGASIYSCSEIAMKEFPNLDVNIISAISIARRLNDPLCELVKIEPKHIGVGMYQHDVNEKDLSTTLNEVVSECVSFVGIDINTASVSLLKHVAGMSETRAQNLVKYRTENGPFKQRKDILKVKMIGEKTFIQCAGFIKIDQMSLGSNSSNYNILDSTWIHPESYELVEKLIPLLGLNKMDIGKPHFISKIQSSQDKIQFFSEKFKQPIERIQSIFEALQRDISRDYRSDFNKKPLFKVGITKLSDLKIGTTVSGAITNLVDFGCFVDIGVERDGLIHSSKLKGNILNIGDHVEAKVISIDMDRGRIGLELNVLSK